MSELPALPMAAHDPAHLRADDLAVCLQILAEGSKSFAAASRVLPARVRAPASALYAFCRVADDLVDTSGIADAVPELERRLNAIYAGAPAMDAVDRAFAAVVLRSELPRAVPDALIEGFAWDVEGRTYEDLSGVIAYSARVAATVGVAMTVLMGSRDPHVIARACDLGVAMQLTNIARDVGEDARNGRIYLPLSWLREEGVDPAEILADPRHRPSVGRVVLRLLDEADRLYDRSMAGIGALPLDCRLSIGSARKVYRDIGRIVREQRGDAFTSRAHTSRGRKLWLVLSSLDAIFASRVGLGAPPLPEVAFLVDAVAT